MAEKSQRSADRKRRAQERALRERAAAEAWQAQVDAHFGFLRTDYGFTDVVTDASSVWETFVIYRSVTTAVKIVRSVEFDRVEAEVEHLGERVQSSAAGVGTKRRLAERFWIESLLELRAPELFAQVRAIKGLGEGEVEQSLQLLSEGLAKHGDDVLRGDFAVAAQIGALLDAKARERAQGVSAWLSSYLAGGSSQQVSQDASQAPRKPAHRRPGKGPVTNR